MSSYYYAKKREAEPTARETRDAILKEKIMEVWKGRKGREVYGARKVWLELNRQGIPVARCTVERLMRGLGIGGARARRKRAAARRVDGVTMVHNNLMVVLPDSDYRDDVQLATAANNAPAQNVTVPEQVEAIADDGNITLTGTVSYLTERAAAEATVAGLAGVRNVRNHIDISYVIDPVDVDLHVQQALDRSAMVPDDSDVTSGTKDGVITLTGHVRTWAEHDAVVGAAWMALGVIEVRDELQVAG